jgi:hypothetical protein
MLVMGLVASVIVGAVVKSIVGTFLFYGAIILLVIVGVKQIDKLKQPLLDVLVVLIGGYAVASGVMVRNYVTTPARKPVVKHEQKEERPKHERPKLIGEDVEAFTEGGPIGPEGQEVTCDIPESLRMHNTVGTNRQGLCVFTSINYCANYQNEDGAKNLQHDMVSEPGGGFPDKVDAMMKKHCPDVKYLQYSGDDIRFLEEVLVTGRPVAVTYSGRDTHYNGKTIAHMVTLVHLDEHSACILDNNFEKQYYWMTRNEFIARTKNKRTGAYWAVALLASPPPPVPFNIKQEYKFAWE